MILTACSPSIPLPQTSGASPTPAEETLPDLAEFYPEREGAFSLYDNSLNRNIRFNPQRCKQGFLPASTFKILNALIGLETGVIPDENYVIRWDGTHYPIPAWNGDQTLRTATQNSVVWYFQVLARQVGKERMATAVKAAAYGNTDISGKIDSFWLDGALRISPDEQVLFLRRLFSGDLPFSAGSMDTVKDLIVLEKNDFYTFYGKTGSVLRQDTALGWFVGVVETKDRRIFFAANLESAGKDGIANGIEAQKISVQILHHLGYLP